MSTYRAAWWLPDPHTATLWGRIARREPPLDLRFEECETPDGDFLELAHLDADSDPAATPRVLMMHGLEGGMHSHYVRAMFRECRARGWNATLMLFRTCGTRPNRLPRSYHSGETTDAEFIIERMSALYPDAPLGLVGVSLGGNVLCKLLGERGTGLPSNVRGAVAMSVPYDLARASRHFARGFGKVYEYFFLKSLIPKALSKIARHPELASLTTVSDARTVWEFDDRFTAPVHGFIDAADYYEKSSAMRFLPDIRIPTLLMNAVDDPFLPPEVLDDVRRVVRDNPFIELEFPKRGGHVGFTSGRWPWRPFYYGEWRAAQFLATRFGRASMDRAREGDDIAHARPRSEAAA